MQPKLDIDWQWGREELQVTVLGRFTAAEKRSLKVDYTIDVNNKIIILHCELKQSGRIFHHDSVLRGFCQIPLRDLKGLDPEHCDWKTELISD